MTSDDEATPAVAAVVREALARHAATEGALLPILHDVQDALGHIPRAAVPRIAAGLNLSRAEVHGVVSYYHHFRSEPAGRTVVQVCRAEACQSKGGEALLAHARRTLGCPEGQATSADGAWSVEPVYCLGMCASSPAAMVGERVHGRLAPAGFNALVSTVPAAPSPQPSASGSASDAPRRVYVSCDSAAVAVGADDIAAALASEAAARGLDVQVVRTSSRGLFWLEPLVEVDTSAGRVGHGPVTVHDVPSLLAAGLDGSAHPLSLGLVEQIPFLARQQRLTFARAGVTEPLSLADYEAHGGGAGLRAALAMAPDAIWQQVLDAGLRGRGGAAFPAGIKWRTVAQAAAPRKYVVCNADEGDSGTFADRMLLEGDPYLLIEGMAIAALACGATKGYVYIRSEYPAAVATFGAAVARAREAGWLGADVLGSGRAFDIEVRKAAGSYVCGEETAMLESIEGKRGIVRAKPPLPALSGLFGAPTVINNVLTFAAAPLILAKGAAFYKNFGVGRSTGTLPFQIAGNVKHGGLVELAFGVTLRELVFGFGGGSASGRPVKAVQVGGPLGTYLPESQWDLPLDYEAYAAVGAVVGHGGLVVHDDTADMSRLARYAMEFCAIESCGKCTPCRIGSTRGVEVIDRLVAGRGPERERQETLLRDLCDTLLAGSLCAMGGMTPYPVLSALDHFPQDFGLGADDRAAA